MNIPTPATAVQMRDYFEWHVQNGRASGQVMFDRRGLQYLLEKHEPGVGMPPIEESFSSDGRIYVRVVF